MFKSLFKKCRTFLSKISFGLGKKLKNLLSRPIDEVDLNQLEKLFFESDIGPVLANKLASIARANLAKGRSVDDVIAIIHKELFDIIDYRVQDTITDKPHIIVLVGANGSGKTTSAAKLAAHYKSEGLKVLLVACDTFRIAAIEQLSFWADKLGIDIMKTRINADAAALAFDSIGKAKAKNIDVVIIDTAGRLHTKEHLMKELQKIGKVCSKQLAHAPHETLLVMDSNIGQNGLDQAKIFNEAIPITGLILTKLDGSAKGGLAIALKNEQNLDIKWVGTGEKVADLALFTPKDFIDSLIR